MGSKKVWLTGALSVALLGVGATGVTLYQAHAADASTTSNSAGPSAEFHHKGNHKKGFGTVTSSIQVTSDQSKSARDAAKQAYQAKLAPLAKITEDQAKAAALSNVSGSTFSSISLKDLRGNLVYLAVVTKDNQNTVVIVDAGNGTVLKSMVQKPHQMKNKQNQNTQSTSTKQS